MEKIAVVAHRGASDGAPENTVPALTKARDMGVDAIAYEVQGASDGEPIVFADVRLERTTNGSGRVSRMSLEEIRRLDAGSWFSPDFAGTPVPTLEEALKAVSGPPALLIQLPEVKAGAKLEGRLIEVLGARKPDPNDCLFFTDSDSLQRIRERLPGYRLCLVLEPKANGWLHLEKAQKLGLTVVRPPRAQIDGVMVREAHGRGVKVFAFFADEEPHMRELFALGVDGVYTHRPVRLKTAIEVWLKETGARA